MRTFDDLLIACQRLIGGALRERVRRGEDEGSLGWLVHRSCSGHAAFLCRTPFTVRAGIVHTLERHHVVQQHSTEG